MIVAKYWMAMVMGVMGAYVLIMLIGLRVKKLRDEKSITTSK